ncbi:hypothetical protein HGB47_20645 [Leptospira yasudae]|uniref:coiled-coil domain-containing protein n=1 Tax=Leptospira yasudae TaxID=2202201 RepID=UPI001C4E33B6|nr:hypothetical protein [Leptospira yasudae]MBW0436019.1 hypothetical protein [Leptospira yasudae]
MKKLIFESIWMLSQKEKKARKVSFSPKKNLIVGKNHVGKSSLTKTIFQTIGAKPTGKLEKWDEDVISILQISAGEKEYYILHQRGNRALFSKNRKLIGASSDHSSWTNLFADAIGFNLVVTDKNNETVQADPKCFFLPFYINQDGSWYAGWDTFVGLQQYKAPIGTILDYFSGIRPPEYYLTKSKQNMANFELEKLRKELDFLLKARERFNKVVPLSGSKIDPSNFKSEVETLTAEVNDLNSKQEVLRKKVIQEEELINSLKLQIELAEKTLSLHDKDYEFLGSSERESLICPICGAEHAESFLDLLHYNEDARILRELIIRLGGDLSKVKHSNSRTLEEFANLQEKYDKINEILDTRKGELNFRDVVDNIGSEKAFEAFESESKILKDLIGDVYSEVKKYDETLKELSDKKKADLILKSFREGYAEARSSLNLPPTDVNKLKLNSRPNLSGSGGPRSVLGYYFSLWRVMFAESSAYAVPIVIDSPNQQAQDDLNLEKVYNYISNNLPSSSQSIVCAETDTGLRKLYNKTIILDKPYSILINKEYAEVEKMVIPLFKRMFEGLKNNK